MILSGTFQKSYYRGSFGDFVEIYHLTQYKKKKDLLKDDRNLTSFSNLVFFVYSYKYMSVIS